MWSIYSKFSHYNYLEDLSDQQPLEEIPNTDYSADDHSFYLKKNEDTGQFEKIGKAEILANLIKEDPIFAVPKQSEISLDELDSEPVKVDPRDFEKDGSHSAVFFSNQCGKTKKVCNKPAKPQNGTWKCSSDGQECSLLCDEGYMVERPVTIR